MSLLFNYPDKMIKTNAIAVFLLFAQLAALAQTRQAIIGLHHQLLTAKEDTTRIRIKIDLCALHRLGNLDSSIYYGQQALITAEEIKYYPGEILALSFMAITKMQTGELPQSLEMALKALQIAELHKLDQYTAPALNAIGEVYVTLKDYPMALGYLRKQKVISEAYNNSEGIAYALSDIGVVHEEMNNLDSAIHYEELAITAFQKTNREEPFVFKALGDINLKLGNQNEALRFYQRSLQIAIENNERRSIALAYTRIASFYKDAHQPDSGIHYATKALEESKLIAQKRTLMEAAILLSDFYHKKDPEEAFRYLKIADAYKDSLFGAGNLQAIQALVAKEEEHQQEIVNARIKYQNQVRQYALIGGLGIVLIIAVILYRNNRQKQKANITLQKQKEEIQSALAQLKSTQAQLIQSEKMASLGELTAGIAHEIQNPLNFVNNFSEVNEELLTEMKDEMTKGKIENALALASDAIENQKKINHHGKRADVIVKGMLQHSSAGSGQKEPTDINALSDEYLRLAYHGLKAKDKLFNATMKTDFDESLSTDEAGVGNINIIPQDIGRVILNLVNNAFYTVNEKKKRIGEGYEPTVSVSSKKLPDKVEVRVQDNGDGIPQKVLEKIFQPFFTTKPTGQGTGLGLSLAYDIVKAHGGALEVTTREGEGSEFIIQLPVV